MDQVTDELQRAVYQMQDWFKVRCNTQEILFLRREIERSLKTQPEGFYSSSSPSVDAVVSLLREYDIDYWDLWHQFPADDRRAGRHQVGIRFSSLVSSDGFDFDQPFLQFLKSRRESCYFP